MKLKSFPEIPVSYSKMIKRKSREEIKLMRHAGHIVALVHQKMKEVVEPGISTK